MAFSIAFPHLLRPVSSNGAPALPDAKRLISVAAARQLWSERINISVCMTLIEQVEWARGEREEPVRESQFLIRRNEVNTI